MAKLVYKNGEFVDKETGKPVPKIKRWDFRQPWGGNISGDYEGYECPVSGKWIEGRKAHRDNLARTGCRILEPGEAQANAKRLEQRKERELDRAIDASLKVVAKDFL